MKIMIIPSFFVLFFLACSFKSSPEYIAKDYIKALNDGDLKTAKSYVYVLASVQDELSPAEVEQELLKSLKIKVELIKSYELDFKKCKIINKEQIAKSLKFQLECQSKKPYNAAELELNPKAKKIHNFYTHSFIMLKLDEGYKIVENYLD